jgi:hypothetical protein
MINGGTAPFVIHFNLLSKVSVTEEDPSISEGHSPDTTPSVANEPFASTPKEADHHPQKPAS